jgi:hypothetical protein
LQAAVHCLRPLGVQSRSHEGGQLLHVPSAILSRPRASAVALIRSRRIAREQDLHVLYPQRMPVLLSA